jgi:hypothetical protein
MNEGLRCCPVTCIYCLRSQPKNSICFPGQESPPRYIWEVFLHEPHCSIFVLRKQTCNTDNAVSYLTQRLSLQCAAGPCHIDSCCSTMCVCGGSAEWGTFTQLSDKVTILYVVLFPYVCWRHCTHMCGLKRRQVVQFELFIGLWWEMEMVVTGRP